MKKVVALVLMLLMVLPLCGCEKGKKDGDGGYPASGSDLSWEEIQRQVDKELEAEGWTEGED